jgi:hypothetical protein
MTRLVSAWVLVNGLLLAPGWVSSALTDTPPTALISLEAALLVGAMVLLPRRPWSRALAWVLAVGIVLAALASFVDLVFRQGLGRPLNLSLDLYLLDAVYRLAVGNTGLPRTIFGIGAIVVVGGLALFATAWLLTPTSLDWDRRLTRPTSKAASGILAGTAVLALIGWGVSAPALSLAVDQLRLFGATRAERAVFASQLEQPSRFTGIQEPLSGLDGRDVVLAYIESYGMAALEDPEFAATLRPRLQLSAAELESAGLHLATGSLTSPTTGGQSWYAHGTMLSGLWLENQLRYELLLTSERETLIDDFRRAGYRTATVMPAITTAWPEAVRIGYDDIYTHQTIPYAGPPFYWVTMPDQFTWSFLGGLLRDATTPLFVEAGMLSSHAPWTPLVPIVAWDDMGDGSVLEPYRLEGYPPEEIWWDVEVLRGGYARSVDYSLRVMTEFAERYLDDRTLLIVLGDHQAAPWVTAATGAEVPVHVISRDASVLEPFLAWGFSPGAFPDAGDPPPRMDEFREWFVRAFSETPAP